MRDYLKAQGAKAPEERSGNEVLGHVVAAGRFFGGEALFARVARAEPSSRLDVTIEHVMFAAVRPTTAPRGPPVPNDCRGLF